MRQTTAGRCCRSLGKKYCARESRRWRRGWPPAPPSVGVPPSAAAPSRRARLLRPRGAQLPDPRIRPAERCGRLRPGAVADRSGRITMRAPPPHAARLFPERSATAPGRSLPHRSAGRRVVDKRLWTGIAQLVGGGHNSTALVGTPEQVADALLDYYGQLLRPVVALRMDHDARSATARRAAFSRAIGNSARWWAPRSRWPMRCSITTTSGCATS
jgi:hypothetical protein